ncbi:heterokaryon incompatibility protein-domain-containing protein [Biscogniauxia marginata]|nr:heterokaryon incompatibility protein-domain-containing protein [Biscogniauxia marginata]
MKEPERYVFAHHVDFESFERSRAQGCAMCNRFQPAQEDETLNPRLKELGCFSAFTVAFPLPSSRVTMYIHYGETQGGFDFVPYQDVFNDDLNFNISKSTQDDDAWVIVQRWLKDCDENHTLCHCQGDFFPTRLLQLEQFGNRGKLIRLVQSSTIDPKERYACLSHRWSRESAEATLGLSKASQRSLEEGVSVDGLPKTFQDAFQIIERSGIRYLWIDCLCTFQDSDEDRKAETSSINDIYKNSYFNIAALGAKDDDDGFFFSRDPEDVKVSVFDVRVDSQGSSMPYLFDLDRTWGWTMSLRNEPLIDHGWFVQERLLAPRTLLFGTKQIFWECKENVACELHPNGSPNSGPGSKEQAAESAFKSVHGLSLRPRSDDPLQQLVLDWYSIVAYYSSTELSLPTDKLAVISGIVKKMETKLAELGSPPTRYLAGIWTHTLPESLLWNLRGGASRSLEASWSWASVNGTVNIQSSLGDNVIWSTEVLGANYGVVGQYDATEVQSKVIKLRGPLAMVVVPQPNEQWGFRALDRKLDSLQDPEESGRAKILRTDYEERFMMKWNISFDVAEDVTDRALLLLMRAQPWGEIWHITGLALKEGCVSNSYQRVGIVNLNVPDEDSASRLIGGFSNVTVAIF